MGDHYVPPEQRLQDENGYRGHDEPPLEQPTVVHHTVDETSLDELAGDEDTIFRAATRADAVTPDEPAGSDYDSDEAPFYDESPTTELRSVRIDEPAVEVEEADSPHPDAPGTEPDGIDSPEPAAAARSREAIRWPPRKQERVEQPPPDVSSVRAEAAEEQSASTEPELIAEPAPPAEAVPADGPAIPAEPRTRAESDARAQPATPSGWPGAPAEDNGRAEQTAPADSIAATATEPEPATTASPADDEPPPAPTPATRPGRAATKPATAARALRRAMSWRGSRPGRFEEDEAVEAAVAPPLTAVSPADTDAEAYAGESSAAPTARAKARRIKWSHAEPSSAPARPEAAEPRPPTQERAARAARAKARLIKWTHAEPTAFTTPAERAEPEPLTQAHTAPNAPAQLLPAAEPAAAPQPAAALTEPEPLTQTPTLPDVPLTFRERGRLRQRARYLRHLREVQIRDLGGFVLELHRFDTWRGDLVGVKLAAVAETDRELRGLESVLDEQRSSQEVREAGIGGACRQCGAIHGSVDRFCAACGVSLEGAGAGPFAEPRAPSPRGRTPP